MSIKEENLIQYSGTIKAGQRLIKVGNTFMPVGVGGAFEPGSGGGGSMKFYKCASVDTSTKTWTGYELVLQDGVYSVSDVVTEGLSYSGFEPLVGRIYSEDGMLEVSSFYEGFHLVSPTDMTSEENDEWKITASGYLGSDTRPYLAFNGAKSNPIGWISAGYGYLPQWIQWQHKSRKMRVTSYSLQSQTNLNGSEAYERFPRTWELQGSNNGSDWVTVDKREDAIVQSDVILGETYSFTCQSPGSYSYYRIYATKNASGNTGQTFIYIGQIKAYGQFE